MKIEIIYVFHNCFIVKFFAGGRTVACLFDYPGDEYLDGDRRRVVAAQVAATDLFVFASHFHADHFNRGVMALGTAARHVTYILSRDILKKNRAFKDDPSCLIVAPDQAYSVADLEIETFRSNDEGVAFLIQTHGLVLYFGGDLADWAWEDNTPAEKRFLEEHFHEVTRKLRARRPAVQIAFSNTDARLKNWAGAAEFVTAVQPRLFVPMHSFGKTEIIAGFMAEHPDLKSPVFHYRNTGDSMTMEIE